MPKRIVIRYKPHAGQAKFHFHPVRFGGSAAGGRWGKTLASARWFLGFCF